MQHGRCLKAFDPTSLSKRFRRIKNSKDQIFKSSKGRSRVQKIIRLKGKEVKRTKSKEKKKIKQKKRLRSKVLSWKRF